MISGAASFVLSFVFLFVGVADYAKAVDKEANSGGLIFTTVFFPFLLICSLGLLGAGIANLIVINQKKKRVPANIEKLEKEIELLKSKSQNQEDQINAKSDIIAKKLNKK